MEVLSEHQVQFYRDNGFVMLESQIPGAVVDECVAEIERFRQEAASLDASNDRLDLEDTHTRQDPRVRRIKLPHTVSAVFSNLMRSDHVLAPVRDHDWAREDQIKYLDELGMPRPPSGSTYSINRGLWGVTIGGRETLDSAGSIPESAWVLSPEAFVQPQPASQLTLSFAAGVPVAP